jgi:hypothetical protein
MADVTFEWKITLGTQEKTYTRTRPAQCATDDELDARQAPGVDFDLDADLLDRLLWRAVVFQHNRHGSRLHGRDATPMEP